MGYPWDPFPLPLLGDPHDSVLFEALGRALERWEQVELGLSFMYSLFVGDPTFHRMRDYGAGKIFRDRLTSLRLASDAWFIRNSNQAMEGRFDRLASAAEGFADRRNEIAHGLVVDVRGITFWHATMTLASPRSPHFLLVPPLHYLRKHDETGMPKYGYSSAELNALRRHLEDLEVAIHRFKSDLWPTQWPEAQPGP